MSRILGLVRDILMAVLLGVSPGTDVFFVALSFSQMLRGMMIEGPVLQTMVSVFLGKTTQHGLSRATILGSRLSGWLIVVSLLLILSAFVLPIWVVSIVGTGFLFDPERGALAEAWMPIALVYLLPITLVGVLVALQNTTNRFAATAITPIIFNLCLIVALYFGADQLNSSVDFPIVMLAIPIAGLLQYGFHVWRSQSIGIYHAPLPTKFDDELRSLLVLLGPALLTVLVMQANVITNNIIGSFLPIGSISWINYANRIAILPVGIIGIALVTVIVPSLSSHYVKSNISAFKALLGSGMRILLLLGMAATVGISVLAEPIAITLFRYGALVADDALRISWVLQALCLNIPASMLSSLFMAALFVSRNYKIPLRIAAILLPIGVLIKLALALALTQFGLPYVGLAIGVSIVAWIHTIILWRTLSQLDLKPVWTISVLPVLSRQIIALSIMAGALIIAPDINWLAADWQERGLSLLADCIGGLMVYFGVLWLLGERIPRNLLRNSDDTISTP